MASLSSATLETSSRLSIRPCRQPLTLLARVGRSAAAQSLDADAITMAVVASIRHEDTRYDSLLMSGIPREDARAAVRAEIDVVRDRWRQAR
jgi:hypothetical protein